nr:MAG TPA: hypothetical protein [Bacteriophage sp.]
MAIINLPVDSSTQFLKNLILSSFSNIYVIIFIKGFLDPNSSGNLLEV